MRKFIGAGLVWLALVAVVGQAGEFNEYGVKAVSSADHYSVSLNYRGKDLGTFSKDDLADLKKGIAGAANLIKKKSTKDQLEEYRNKFGVLKSK